MWAQTCKHLIAWGLSAAQLSTALFGRTLVLYAIAQTGLFALIVVKLCRWRAFLERQSDAPAQQVARLVASADEEQQRRRGQAAADAPIQTASAAATTASDSPAPSVAPAAVAPLPLVLGGGAESASDLLLAEWKGTVESFRQLEAKLTRRAAACKVMVLLEATMGWVSGCAWTDAIVYWSPLNEYPQPRVCAKDVGLAIGLNVLAYSWLVGTAGKAATIDDSARNDREKVEHASPRCTSPCCVLLLPGLTSSHLSSPAPPYLPTPRPYLLGAGRALLPQQCALLRRRLGVGGPASRPVDALC